MANETSVEKTGGLLNKSDVSKSFWTWQFFSHANYNYERMQGGSFAACMSPIIDKLYPKLEDRIAAYQRHLVFFNTNPNFGTLIHGAVIAMEEQRAEGAEISDEAINAVKTGLMGPLAGIGDTLDQGIIIPIVVALGISIASAGNVFGSILVLVALPIILISLARFFYFQGYKLGSNAVIGLLSSGRMRRMVSAAGIMGCTVMGGLISSYVTLSTTVQFNIGEQVFDLQTQLFDPIMPNLLPLAVTALVFWLLHIKNVNSVKVMVLIMVVGFLGGLAGIF